MWSGRCGRRRTGGSPPTTSGSTSSATTRGSTGRSTGWRSRRPGWSSCMISRSTGSSSASRRRATRPRSRRRARPRRSARGSPTPTWRCTSRSDPCGRAAVARASRGIVVHSAFCKRYLESAGVRTPIFTVPHPVVEDEVSMRRAEPRARELRATLEAAGARTVVVAPGDVNEAKCLPALVEAIATLPDGRPRRARRTPDPGDRHRRDDRRPRGGGSGDRAPRRPRRRLPGVARRRRSRRRPPVPASRRGQRVALDGDGRGPPDDRLGDRDVPRHPGGPRGARRSGAGRPRGARAPDPGAPGRSGAARTDRRGRAGAHGRRCATRTRRHAATRRRSSRRARSSPIPPARSSPGGPGASPRWAWTKRSSSEGFGVSYARALESFERTP